MKKIIYLFSVTAAITIISCNSNSSGTDGHSAMNHNDSMPMPQNTVAETDVKRVPVTFANVDPAVAAFMKSMMKDYLDVKNALVGENESAARSASEKISATLKGFDKSLLSAEQKKVYDDAEDDLKEQAEHIAKSKIDHQRDHFVMMSENMYNLVKAFGTGMTIYHDHCPMYKEGSMWLSETKEIRNLYYGGKMMGCGNVMEMFK